jgi:hypothetical protein
MEEDKKLRSLLSEYAMHEPSPSFNNSVMQRIEASKNASSVSSINPLIAISFAVVAVILLIVSFFIHPALFRQFSVSISQGTYMQLFSFFAAFWFVMFVNTWWNKKITTK